MFFHHFLIQKRGVKTRKTARSQKTRKTLRKNATPNRPPGRRGGSKPTISPRVFHPFPPRPPKGPKWPNRRRFAFAKHEENRQSPKTAQNATPAKRPLLPSKFSRFGREHAVVGLTKSTVAAAILIGLSNNIFFHCKNTSFFRPENAAARRNDRTK